ATVFTIGGRQAPGSEWRPPRDCMYRRSRATWSAPSRSALLTTKMSAVSRMPALAAWMPSPIPGASSTAVGSASEAISPSALPHAAGLAQHDATAGGVEHPQRLRHGGGQPAEVPAGCHGPDEHAIVGGVVLHPHPVAEQRSARERRRRVDGQHADPLAVLAQCRDE